MNGPMATVIGIFEKNYREKNDCQLLVREHNQEDLLMCLILLKYATKPGKEINVLTIVYQTKILIRFFKLQRCLIHQ